jgi:SAM-dependent methyltransferase
MEIGAQQLAGSFISASRDLERLGGIFGVGRTLVLGKRAQSAIVHGELEHLDATAPSAREFWSWLGFQYAAIDIDGSTGSIPLDLNFDDAPAAERGRYDLVTNFGTTEHVANQLNAFEIIHDLTAPGGVMIHQVPAQGMLNHGLINYNFKFFWMLGRSNGYKFVHVDFTPAQASYQTPENISEFVARGDPTVINRMRSYRTVDVGILVVMVKTFDIPFVPPLDVPTGTKTNIVPLRKRYWTVFQPEAFGDLRPHHSGLERGPRHANVRPLRSSNASSSDPKMVASGKSVGRTCN